MTTEDFRRELQEMLAAAQAKGLQSVEVEAGHLHERVGGYPGRDHRMPLCCNVMRKAMAPGDEVVAGPPGGAGASLTVRYLLPRP